MREVLLLRVQVGSDGVGIKAGPHGEDVKLIQRGSLLQEGLVARSHLGVVPGVACPRAPQLEVTHALLDKQ